MFLWFMQPDIWLTLITLTFLEIILGVDNIIFLSLVVAKLPLSQQNMARKLGLSCAMIMRILLLISIAWLSHITQPLFTVLTLEISFRTLILLGGGLFLIYKAIQEIREELSPAQEDEHGSGSRQLSLCGAIVQIMLLDIVFSPGFGDHRRRPFSAYIYHDCRRNDCRRCHDVCGENNW